MKKAVLLLGIFLVIGLSSCSKKIQEGDFVFTYTMFDSYGYITKYSGNDANVEVPAKINDIEVWGAGEGTFKDLPNLRKVTFLGARTSLRSGAFENCPNLNNITYAGKLDWISDTAFVNCPSMPAMAASSGGSGNRALIGSWYAPQTRGRLLDELRFVDGNTCYYIMGGSTMGLEYTYTFSGSRVSLDNGDFVYELNGNTLTDITRGRGRVFTKR